MTQRVQKGFNRLAPYYDLLTNLVFGKSIKIAQVAFLDHIKPGSRILILGGGTGWILEEIDRLNISVKVDYVDLSQEMLNRAKKVHCEYPKVNFVHGTVEDVPVENYDVVVTNFYLDLFNSSLDEVMMLINERINHAGIWLITDFRRAASIWQKGLLSFMHFFFWLICGIEAKRLEDFEERMKKLPFDQINRRLFYSEMIFSSVYVKR